MPRLLWGSLLTSQIVYVFVAHVAITGPAHEGGLAALPFVAAICLTAAIIIPRMMARQMLKTTLSADLTIATVPVPQLVTTMFTPLLVRFAMIEVVGVLGMVSAMTSGDSVKVYPFAAAAVVAMLINFPSEGKLRDFGR